MTWKVIDIKPSRAEGLAEVTVLVSNPKGQQSNKLYIGADGQHAVIGDIIPFGVHPFEAVRKELDQGGNGPTRGPAACAAKPETTGRVQHSIALGTSVDVTGTPTLFINGRKIANVSGIPYDLLKSLVEFAAKEGK